PGTSGWSPQFLLRRPGFFASHAALDACPCEPIEKQTWSVSSAGLSFKQVDVEWLGDIAVVRLMGTLQNLESMTKALRAFFDEQQPRKLLLNMANVEDIDKPLIGLLLRLRQTMQQSGKLILCAVDPS